MGGLAGAWLAGVSITAWREIKSSGHMPVPAALLGVTGLFVVLSLLAEAIPPARQVITVGAWGLDLAGLFNVLPAGLFGQVQATQRTEQQAESGKQSAGGPPPIAV